MNRKTSMRLYRESMGVLAKDLENLSLEANRLMKQNKPDDATRVLKVIQARSTQAHEFYEIALCALQDVRDKVNETLQDIENRRS